jgi:REP element-mobilizing transposase RayT
MNPVSVGNPSFSLRFRGPLHVFFLGSEAGLYVRMPTKPETACRLACFSLLRAGSSLPPASAGGNRMGQGFSSRLEPGFSTGDLSMLSTTSHVFSEIFIHLNWHCKDNRPLIHAELEQSLSAYVRNYCNKTKGIRFLGIGGTCDHVHLVIQLEPFLCLADWVGKVKGASSHDLNLQFGKESLLWQRGYGAISFAQSNLKAVLEYVGTQKQHHRMGTINKVMERHGDYQENNCNDE